MIRLARHGAGVALAVGLAIACPAAAGAAERTETYRYGPIAVGPYAVDERDYVFGIPGPEVDGYITGGRIRLVDAGGRRVPMRRVMLHHVVFANVGRRLGDRLNPTCERITLFDSMTQVPALSEPVFGSAEEEVPARLPAGYGYPIRADDRWTMSWMLMNHRNRTESVYIEYEVTYVTGETLKPVYPIWLDVRDCSLDPIFDVPGGRGRGSTFSTSTTIRAPFSGRIVAGLGHLHGGGKSAVLSQPECGDRELLRSIPTWGGPRSEPYRVRPLVHEPGPVDMSFVTSAQGFPVRAGEPLKLTANYDGELPHTRVMGILGISITPDASVKDECAPLPTDVQVRREPGPADPPRVRVPINGVDRRGRVRPVSRPPGAIVRMRGRPTIDVTRFRFEPANVAVPQGAQLTWRFWDAALHNVTLAGGPRGFSSPNLSEGRSFTQRLSKAGTYRLYCSLHPTSMAQTVTVLKRGRSSR